MNTFPNSCCRIFFAYLCATLLISGCATTPAGPRIDNVPMYGQPQIVRPDFLRQADEQFIREAVAGFGTREKASDIWWAQAEAFMAQNNLDFAMRRYNQAWLLNQNNFKAYWGFARVLLAQGAIEPAFVHLEKAMILCADNFQRPALLSDAGSAYSNKASSLVLKDRDDLFQKADSFFEQALKIDSSYGNAYKRWAISLYHQEKYSEAWIKIAEARRRPDANIPPAFLRALKSKMPEPN